MAWAPMMAPPLRHLRSRSGALILILPYISASGVFAMVLSLSCLWRLWASPAAQGLPGASPLAAKTVRILIGFGARLSLHLLGLAFGTTAAHATPPNKLSQQVYISLMHVLHSRKCHSLSVKENPAHSAPPVFSARCPWLTVSIVMPVAPHRATGICRIIYAVYCCEDFASGL